jgi:molecular chaperone GrpE
MVQSENNEIDPTDGAPDSEDAFARAAGQTAEDDFSATSGGVSPGVPANELERRLAEAQDRFLRQAAEYDNFRKRTAKEKAELTARAQAELVKQLLDPLDDLARFAHVDPATVDPTTIVQGVELVEKKMLKTLANAGLESLNPVNQTFDPKLHEAVTTEPALSPEDDHVVSRVFQVGYLFNGQLLRPARVVVKQWNG